LVAGVVSPRVGRLIDRHGGHQVMPVGSLIAALGLVALVYADHPAAYLAVWMLLGMAIAASLYDPVGAIPAGAPYVASVFRHAEAGPTQSDHWQALVDGWDTWWMRSRMCDKTIGRLLYYWDVYTNIFGKICTIVGTAAQTVEVPNNSEGNSFVDFAGVNNNVLRQGSAIINLSLAKADRVTVKIYDVSGRLVRTLADGQMFKAGTFDKALTWDGLDNSGRQVARGAYFVSIRYQNSRFDTAKKMIVLK